MPQPQTGAQQAGVLDGAAGLVPDAINDMLCGRRPRLSQLPRDVRRAAHIGAVVDQRRRDVG